MIKVKVIKTIFFLLFILILISCDFLSFDFSSTMTLINNTNYTLHIECKTTYDDQIYKTHKLDGIEIGYIKIGRLNLQIPTSSILLKKQERYSILFVLNHRDVVQLLGYGTIESLEDTVYAINEIFIELNVYIIENGEKKLLYDKNYFLDKKNIEIYGKSHVNININ